MLVSATFLYTDVYFSSQTYAQNLKHSGAQIPGVNRGQATQKYLARIFRKITFPYSFMLVTVVILPVLLMRFYNLDMSPLLGFRSSSSRKLPAMFSVFWMQSSS